MCVNNTYTPRRIKTSYLPWKHKIRNSEAIPWRMIEEPVAATPIVDKQHQQQTHSGAREQAILNIYDSSAICV